jgi:hypothetical protein
MTPHGQPFYWKFLPEKGREGGREGKGKGLLVNEKEVMFDDIERSQCEFLLFGSSNNSIILYWSLDICI